MANQDHWNRIAQQELANNKGAQNTNGWKHQDKDRYLAARKAAEQQSKK